MEFLIVITKNAYLIIHMFETWTLASFMALPGTFWMIAERPLGPRAVETGLLPPESRVKRRLPCLKGSNAPIKNMSQPVLTACAPLLQPQSDALLL